MISKPETRRTPTQRGRRAATPPAAAPATPTRWSIPFRWSQPTRAATCRSRSRRPAPPLPASCCRPTPSRSPPTRSGRRFQYSDCCQIASQRVYHTIPSSGSGTSGVNYDQSDFGYDVLKRRIRSETPGGTISRQVDVRDQVTESWLGTDDTGATPSDPSGGGATGNNMVIIASQQFDEGDDGGDGLLTRRTQYADASNTRVTNFDYDYRGRRTEIDGEIDFFQK